MASRCSRGYLRWSWRATTEHLAISIAAAISAASAGFGGGGAGLGLGGRKGRRRWWKGNGSGGGPAGGCGGSGAGLRSQFGRFGAAEDVFHFFFWRVVVMGVDRFLVSERGRDAS